MAEMEMKLNTQEWEEVLRVLQAIPDRVQKTVVGQAARASLKHVLSAARGNLRGRPGTTGLLRRSLGIVQRKDKRRGTVYTIVGPRTGFKDPETGENPVNIAHLVEFGTEPHRILHAVGKRALVLQIGQGSRVLVGGVMHPGARAKPFLRPAYDAQKRVVLQSMAGHMRQGILRQVARFEKRAA